MEEQKKLKVYVETSFVCYLTGDPTPNAKIAADQAYTRQWWDANANSVDVCVSEFVANECELGREDAVARRLEVVRRLLLIEPDVAEVSSLAKRLIAAHALPEGETTDALHIAAAAVAGMDYLLTWNCKHMANPRTLPKTRQIVREAGYVCPLIMTPKTFIENESLEVTNG